MGAQQSSGAGTNVQGGELLKRCYYEVLEVERHASDDEIKKAYRRKALELHPDRNYGDAENATAKFAEIQAAYEVLSDPQERAWYDSHRESILRGDDRPAEDHFEHDIRFTSAADIVKLIGRFNTNVPFTDAADGFYGTLRGVFSSLASEEYSTADWEGLDTIQYPDFGRATDNYEDVVKPFYRIWINFSTKKTFSWRDQYRPSDAPDRATRRVIEKENRRLRDEGIREFNDAVRSLVAFVRKRDPRFVPNSQSEADRQKILRDAAAAQAARSRAANQAKLKEHKIPEWAQSQQLNAEDNLSESDESEVEHIECVVCGKTFKSEKQYETHEKSKKHIKAVQQLQREMRKENERFHLDSPNSGDTSTPTQEFDKLEVSHKNSKIEHHTTSYAQGEEESHTFADENPEETKLTAEQNPSPDFCVQTVDSLPEDLSDSSGLGDEYAARLDTKTLSTDLISGRSSQDMNNSTTGAAKILDKVADSEQRLGKAKLKRAKKKARQENSELENQEFRCVACNDSFASKTKLFNHIKEFSHAQPIAKATKGKK